MRIPIAPAAIAIPLASTPARTPTADDGKPQESSSAKPQESSGAKPQESSGAKPLGGRAECRRPDLHPAESVGGGRFDRLGELPPGKLVLTVYREVDGCPDPMIVGQPYGLGEPQGDRTPERILPPARRW